MELSVDCTKAEYSPRWLARRYGWLGYSCAEIAKLLNQPKSTVASWKARDRWNVAPTSDRIGCHLDFRLGLLINMEHKSNAHFKEIDALMRQLERLSRIERYSVTGKESHLNERRAGNHVSKRAPKNEINAEAAEKLKDTFRQSLYGHQLHWFDAKANRIRNILKSRQIGATWYFSREALVDAATGGGNQIFLSASRAQSEVFRNYIVQFAREAADIELKGNPIILADGTELHFLSTNSRTAQSYHGHIYMDEYFWIPRFTEFRKVASGMAMHKRWRQTYFSTPSSITHEAYAFWAAKKRSKTDAPELDVSHQALSAGRLCEDRQWRQVVNIEDAIASGCDLFNIDELREEYSEEEFANLLMCEFIDDAASFFNFEELSHCGVDSLLAWKDFTRSAQRPFGDKPVWIGYDPSRTRDNAALIVTAPPSVPGAPYRALEKHEWKNTDFSAQAESIRKITERYNVEFIGIDTTGIGRGVFDLVRNFYPAVVQINYSPEVKTRLVLRAKELIRSRRMQWDSGWNDMVRAFLAIRRTTTPSGNAVTFDAVRSDTIGHADLAWGLMHSLDNLPLREIASSVQGQQSYMLLSD